MELVQPKDEFNRVLAFESRVIPSHERAVVAPVSVGAPHPEFDTEIDFALAGGQWWSDAHDPIGCAGAYDVGAQSEMQRLVGDGIRKRARRVLLVPAKRLELYPKEQTPPAHVTDTGISLLERAQPPL